jgi:hypothetical protein
MTHPAGTHAFSPWQLVLPEVQQAPGPHRSFELHPVNLNIVHQFSSNWLPPSQLVSRSQAHASAQPGGAVKAEHWFPRLVQGAPMWFGLHAWKAHDWLSFSPTDGQPQRLVLVQHCPASHAVPNPQQVEPQARADGQHCPPAQVDPAAQQVVPHACGAGQQALPVQTWLGGQQTAPPLHALAAGQHWLPMHDSAPLQQFPPHALAGEQQIPASTHDWLDEQQLIPHTVSPPAQHEAPPSHAKATQAPASHCLPALQQALPHT